MTDNPLAAEDQCEEGLDTPGPGEFGSGLIPAEGSGGLPHVIPVSCILSTGTGPKFIFILKSLLHCMNLDH